MEWIWRHGNGEGLGSKSVPGGGGPTERLHRGVGSTTESASPPGRPPGFRPASAGVPGPLEGDAAYHRQPEDGLDFVRRLQRRIEIF